MQTPLLTAAQRAFLFDPEGFRKRMRQRAEAMPYDGYAVEPAEAIGLFVILTPKGEQYTVNALATRPQDACTCPFAVESDIDCECKHRMGLEGLIVEQLAHWKQFAQLGDPRLSQERMRAYDRLRDHWQATLEAATCAQYVEEDRTCEYDRQERQVREAGFAEF